MPTSFKRREPRRPLHANDIDSVSTGASTNAVKTGFESVGTSTSSAPSTRYRGLRPSPFPSPSPLFSSGLASFDDLINGSGIPSSSLLTLCPAIGLTGLSVEAGLAPVHHAHSSKAVGLKRGEYAAKYDEQLKNAQTALDTLMSFGVAQGVIAGHDTIVVARNVRKVIGDKLPKYMSSRYASAGEPSKAIKSQAEIKLGQVPSFPASAVSGRDDMKIAFRYAHRPVFKTTVAEPRIVEDKSVSGIAAEHVFRAPLDLSLRWSPDEILEAEESFDREEGGLHLVETGTYQSIYQEISSIVTGSRKSSSERPLRIHLFDLGGQGWTKDAVHESMEARLVALSQFLLRIRALLKHLTFSDKRNARHAICTCVISPQLLLASWRTIVTQHLLRMSDIELLLSDFTSDDNLSRAYSDYAGSVSLLKGPAIGAGMAPGEHRSILRGGIGESGAENDVGWRWKKRGRGIVFETLHEDFDANLVGQDVMQETTKTRKGGDDIEETALGLPRKQAHTHNQESSESAAKGTNDMTIKTKSFKGLASLRERGLEATRLRKEHEERNRYQNDRSERW